MHISIFQISIPCFENTVDPDQLAETAELDLQCLQKRDTEDDLKF